MNRKLVFAIAAIVLATTIAFAETNTFNSVALVSTNISITPTNLAQLLALSPEQLEKVDIARIDLLCAEGLQGSEDLNVEQCLKALDALAQHVKEETERNRHYFTENPARFKNSEGYFRMMYLATVLQEDFGVQYNPERKNDFVDENGKSVRKQSDEIIFADSKDHFINGLLTGKHYGTCASLPMLYVAVAKRLGCACGDNFSPAAFAKISSVKLIDTNEPGDIGTRGRNRGKPTPGGSATIEISDKAEADWSRFDDLLTMMESCINALREAGADEIWISCSLYHDGQCNFAFSKEELKRIAALNIDMPISCYGDEVE